MKEINIYTSYFAHLRKGRQDIPPIQYSVANSSPYKLETLPLFVPNWTNLTEPYKTGQITPQQFIDRYLSYLQEIPQEELNETLDTLPSDTDIVLLCWEAPNNFCHRHTLAKYLSTLNLENYKINYKGELQWRFHNTYITNTLTKPNTAKLKHIRKGVSIC